MREIAEPMKVCVAVFAAALMLASGVAEAKKKEVRPDEIAELQKTGKLASFDKLNQAALAKHPGGHITNTSLASKDDRYDYRVRITDSNGDNWNLKLDGGSAAVLSDSKALPPVLPATTYVPPTPSMSSMPSAAGTSPSTTPATPH